MSSAQLAGGPSGTGSMVVQAPNTNSAQVVNIPDGSGTMAVQGVSTNIVSGTAQNTTSGTSIDFTSIPAWVKRITVMLNGVSTNGTSNTLIRLGTSGGIVASAYSSGTAFTYTVANTCQAYGESSGFLICTGGYAAILLSGSITFTNLSGNTWVAAGTIYRADAIQIWTPSGIIALSSALTTLRLTTVNGTDTFDAGSINILYE